MPLSQEPRRFLALFAPHLSCDRLVWQANGAQPDGPYAFVEKRSNAMRLVAVDRCGASMGLAPGLTLADARVRVPDFETFAHDARADRLFLERLADACDRYSPTVALDPPDGVTIDITGCTHLFGDEGVLTADAIARFAPFVTLRAAVSHTSEAAQALARFGNNLHPKPRHPELVSGSMAQRIPKARVEKWTPDQVRGDEGAYEERLIHDLPIVALRLSEDATMALLRAGLKTVGDLACRPSAALAARFGAVAADRLARTLGRVDSRITPRRALPPVTAERRFPEPIASVDHVIAVAGELLAESCDALEKRASGARQCGLALFRSDGDVRRLTVETGQPVREPAAIMRLLRERIEGLSDPLDPGFGFDMVRVGLTRLEPLAAAQLALEGGSLSDDALNALIDRLSTRLGRGRVRRLVPADTHIPEQRRLALPALDVAKPALWPAPEPGEPPLRPLHLFDPPQSIDVIAEVPDGPPHRFRWRRTMHDVTRAEGPERIAAEWWRRKDGAGLTRDYYRVEDARGRRFWVFRHGLYGTEKAQPGWFLHGLFA